MTEPKLLGDAVEDLLKKVKADKLVDVIETVTRRPCNCKKRKLHLNVLHKKMQDMKNRILVEQKKNAP